ncbi:MAG: hypothetical protein LBL52_02825 [Rickettsiales bacterium]|nr:hypothetical protein [Rickettsiales bacterium]
MPAQKYYHGLMIRGMEYYRDLIGRLGLPEMPLAKVALALGREADKAVRLEFPKLARQAARYAYYKNLQQIVEAGFSKEEAMALAAGHIPAGIDLYMKAPAEYGLALDFTSVFLVRRHPFRSILDRLLLEQVLHFNAGKVPSREAGFALPSELYMPNPKGLVFAPALKGLAGAGGNAATDRMSEIGSTMFLKSDGRV